MRITAARALSVCAPAVFVLPGCVAPDADPAAADPLKQRLLAREEDALRSLLFARAPAYTRAEPDRGSGRRGAYSYLDAPYDGPAVEPPLPDLSMIPEFVIPPPDDPPEEKPPQPQPTPMEPVPTGDAPAPEPAASPAPRATSPSDPEPPSAS